MPYGIDMNYVRATQEGVARGLQRRAALQQLQEEEARERDRLTKLAEEAKRYRTEAVGLGIPKQEAEAMSVGEARGYVEAQAEIRKRKQQEQGRMQAHRDLRAAAATTKSSDQLSPAEVSFMMRQAGIPTPEMAQEMWDNIDRLDRARLMGVQDKTVLDDLAKQQDQERQWAAELRQRKEFQAGTEQRQATLEQTRAGTVATKENQRRQVEREAAAKADLALYGGAREPVFKNGPGGTIVMHVPGQMDDDGSPKWTQRPMEGPLPSMMRQALTPREAAEQAAGQGTGEKGQGTGEKGQGTGEKGQGTTKEVRRKTADGKIAVFDGETKKFLRYE